MDIAQNSIAAEAKNVLVEVIEDTKTDLLQMTVQDDGKGMDSEFLKLVSDPFTTSRTTRKVGLGIPLLKEAAELANGSLTIDSKWGTGTKLVVKFQRSHIDRMPLGNLADTFLSLAVSYPNIHFVMRYCLDGIEFLYDDEPIKKELGDISLTEPGVISYLRKVFDEGISEVQKTEIYNH